MILCEPLHWEHCSHWSLLGLSQGHDLKPYLTHELARAARTCFSIELRYKGLLGKLTLRWWYKAYFNIKTSIWISIMKLRLSWCRHILMIEIPVLFCSDFQLKKKKNDWDHLIFNGNSYTGKMLSFCPGEFPVQRPVTRSFDVFFDLRLNKQLSKQSWGWWFETPPWSLWCQCNDNMVIFIQNACNRHTIACMWRQAMRCLLWVQTPINLWQ